jgi:hypothetical protein
MGRVSMQQPTAKVVRWYKKLLGALTTVKNSTRPRRDVDLELC